MNYVTIFVVTVTDIIQMIRLQGFAMSNQMILRN